MNARLSTVALLALAACSSNPPTGPGSIGPGGSTDDAATSADSPTSATGNAESPRGDAGADGAPTVQPTTYAPHLVGFDDLTSGTTVTDQYKQWFTVSTIPGCALQTSSNYDFGQSKPNYVSTYFSCASGATADVSFTFTRAVRRVAFKGIGVNGTKGVALMKITHDDGATSEASLDGTGAPLTPVPVTVPDTAPIIKLVITSIQDA